MEGWFSLDSDPISNTQAGFLWWCVEFEKYLQFSVTSFACFICTNLLQLELMGVHTAEKWLQESKHVCLSFL